MWSSTIQKGNSCPSTVRTPWAPYRPLPTSALFKAWSLPPRPVRFISVTLTLSFTKTGNATHTEIIYIYIHYKYFVHIIYIYNVFIQVHIIYIYVHIISCVYTCIMWRITFWSYEAPQLRVDTLNMETSRKHLPFTTPSPVLPWDWPIQSPGMNRPHPPLDWQHPGDLKRFPINRSLSCSNALRSQNASDVLGLAAWPSSQNLALDI